MKYLPCSCDFTLYLDRLIKLILNVGMGTYFVWLNNFQFTQKAKMCTSWWGIFPVLVHYDAQSCVLRKLGPMACDDCKLVHNAQIYRHSSYNTVLLYRGIPSNLVFSKPKTVLNFYLTRFFQNKEKKFQKICTQKNYFQCFFYYF